MLDLEEIGGGGFRDAYATFAFYQGGQLFAHHDNTLVALPVEPDAMVTVITYGTTTISNALEIHSS